MAYLAIVSPNKGESLIHLFFIVGDNQIQIWLAMAYEAVGRHNDCIALYKRLEGGHPNKILRRQAADLRYILEAPKLKISSDEMVKIPLIEKDFDRFVNSCHLLPIIYDLHLHLIFEARPCIYCMWSIEYEVKANVDRFYMHCRVQASMLISICMIKQLMQS